MYVYKLAACRKIISNTHFEQKEQASYKELIEDALRFLYLFFSVIENYPLQIYASGLLFSPHNSLIRQRFQQHTSGVFSKLPKVDDNWTPIRSIYEHLPDNHNRARTISFAPSSDLLFVTTSFALFRWHVNQEPIPELIERIKTNSNQKMAPSPDGKWLAFTSSGLNSESAQISGQRALHVRDWNLNRIIWSKDLQDRQVLGMGISPDSQCLLVWCDEELQLYDIKGAMPQRWPLEPKDRVIRFSFSSDSTWVALNIKRITVSTIYVFNLRTGKRYGSAKYEHIGRVHDAQFIPNTHSLMICTVKKTVYLWSVLGEKLETWGHFDHRVVRLAFSHSDSWLALMDHDRLYMYDRSHRTLLQVNEVPFMKEIGVSFDDQTIACMTYDSICLLDVQALLVGKQPKRRDGFMKLQTKDGDGMKSDSQEYANPPFIHLTCSPYSRDKCDDEWIKFDDKRLLWLPRQYRGNTLAIEYDLVVIRDLYSIQFAQGADKLMRQALQNLT